MEHAVTAYETNKVYLAGREQRRSQESSTARVGLLERDSAGGGRGAEHTTLRRPGFDGHADVSRDDVIFADVSRDDVRRPDEIPSVNEASLTLNSPEQATSSGVNEIGRSFEYNRMALRWCSARKKLVEAFETRATHLN